MITYTRIGETDGGDSVCIFDGPRIQVAQPTDGSIAGFPGDDWHPICYCFTIHSYFFTVYSELLLLSTQRYGLVQRQETEAVAPGMHGIHLKYRQCLQPISLIT